MSNSLKLPRCIYFRKFYRLISVVGALSTQYSVPDVSSIYISQTRPFSCAVEQLGLGLLAIESAVPCPPNWAVVRMGASGATCVGTLGVGAASVVAGIRWHSDWHTTVAHSTLTLTNRQVTAQAVPLLRSSSDINMRQFLVPLLVAALAQGHGGHDGPEKGETIQQYAQRHVCLVSRGVHTP